MVRYIKVNIFRFWAVGITNKAINRCHIALRELVTVEEKKLIECDRCTYA